MSGKRGGEGGRKRKEGEKDDSHCSSRGKCTAREGEGGLEA